MAAVSLSSPYLVSSPSISRSLEWIDDLQIENSQSENAYDTKSISVVRLCNTSFAIDIGNEAEKWENRVAFIKQTLIEIFSNCSKKERFVFVSLGSNRLLIEYVLGKALIEEGFDPSFLLVEPLYSFGPPEHKEVIQYRLAEFRKNMESIYFKKHGTSLAESAIRYLSRAQNIAKYFPEGSNVVLIESFPPHGQILRSVEIKQAPKKDPQDLLAGSAIVPVEHANAVSFIPNAYFALAQKHGAKFGKFLPLPLFQNNDTKKYFYFDWGCKISKDGSYRIHFSSEKEYIDSIDFSGKKVLYNEDGESYSSDQWPTKIKGFLKDCLSKEIKQIKDAHSVKELSQEQISGLLKKVEQVFLKNLVGGAHSFFLRDYALDRTEAISYISTHAGQYRKGFMLTPDSCALGYKITIEDIK